MSVGIVVLNLLGAVLVYCLAAWVVPIPKLDSENRLRLVNLVGAASYLVVAVTIGVVMLNVALGPMVAWIRAGADPSRSGRMSVLRAPRRMALWHAIAWSLAAFVFGGLNATVSVRLGIDVLLIVLLSGWTVSAFSHLASERTLRGFARMALEGTAPLPPPRSSVWRAMSSWGLGSGVVLFGAALVGLFSLVDDGEASTRSLAVTMLVLGGIGLVVGGGATLLGAKATADPLSGLRQAVQRVQQGDYDVTVPIYDATEIGHLQAGFNRMAAGLAERERIRELFGRHVGDDVARNALSRGVELGGESRRVAVMFVDIVGSTSIAERRDPTEVVELLNRFFAVVVDVVEAHGGWINKFEGDAALAVWGAPDEVPDLETQALRATRVLAERLRAEVPELRASVGVSAGRAVAGNIGAARRSEYTVIGDPVNEAARLTDLAREHPSLALARHDLVDVAASSANGSVEAALWQSEEPVLLRGRTALTPVATPERSSTTCVSRARNLCVEVAPVAFEGAQLVGVLQWRGNREAAQGRLSASAMRSW